MNDTRTLGSLLATHNISKVAQRLNKTRVTVHRWINEECVPSVADLPGLAQVLNMDLADLTPIIVAAAERIAARKAA